MATRRFAWALLAMGAIALVASSASAQRRGRGKPVPQPEESAAAEVEAIPPEPPEATLEPSPAPAAAPAPPSGEAATPETVPSPPPPDTSAAPAAAEAAPAPDARGERAAELAALQQELASVMDELVQARARVAVLGKSLFKSKVRLKIDNRAAPDQLAARVLVWLDGAPIFSGDGAAIHDPERVLFEGFAAPGPHVLTLEVEQRARDDEAYRYTLREAYRFVVVRERRTDLRVVLDDDSDMAEDFKDDEEGAYDIETRFEARALSLDED